MVTTSRIKPYLLNQVEFEDGKNSLFGKVRAYGRQELLAFFYQDHHGLVVI